VSGIKVKDQILGQKMLIMPVTQEVLRILRALCQDLETQVRIFYYAIPVLICY
jgi:hypothetical protein